MSDPRHARVTPVTGLRAAGAGLRDDGDVSSEPDPRASTAPDSSASGGDGAGTPRTPEAHGAAGPRPDAAVTGTGTGEPGPDVREAGTVVGGPGPVVGEPGPDSGEPGPDGGDREPVTTGVAGGEGGTPVAASRPRPRIGPRPMQKPGRTETRMKDMLGALLILIPIALLLVGVTRSCTFAPAGPTVDPNSGPTVDAPARLGEYARISTFPLRVPAVPWRANSTDRGEVVGGGTAVRVGFVTGEGRYLRLVQSDATEENLLRTEAGNNVPTGEGVTPAAGLNWVTYRSGSGEPFRVTAVPTPGSPTPTRLLITGSGNDDEFRALAEATIRAKPLPAGGGTN